jgi:DNA-binding NtrC family response regulator
MNDMSEEISRLLVGESAAIRQLRRDILLFGPTRLPILIQGPTGSGKELVARALHQVGRRPGTLVAFNVCAVSESMFEDALFGHVKGAFTGAHHDSPGYLAEANGGSVFLDEISGLGLQPQAKLLRALETGVYRPVGGGRDRVSDFRLISASNESLAELVETRCFRMDLLQRIGGYVIKVPPLVDRRDDVPLLALHFLAQVRAVGVVPSTRALRRLRDHAWRGNVRELRHVMERLLVMAQGTEIDEAHVADALDTGALAENPDEQRSEFGDRLRGVLRANDWDTAAAARTLNVHRATIYRWMQRTGIAAPPASRLPRTFGADCAVRPEVRRSEGSRDA